MITESASEKVRVRVRQKYRYFLIFYWRYQIKNIGKFSSGIRNSAIGLFPQFQKIARFETCPWKNLCEKFCFFPLKFPKKSIFYINSNSFKLIEWNKSNIFFLSLFLRSKFLFNFFFHLKLNSFIKFFFTIENLCRTCVSVCVCVCLSVYDCVVAQFILYVWHICLNKSFFYMLQDLFSLVNVYVSL